MKIFDETLSRVEQSLDLRLQRHGVLAGNVANLDTPGYRPKDIDFSHAMTAALDGGQMARTSTGHLDAEGGSLGQSLDPSAPSGRTPAPVIEAGGTTPSLDGNRVDLDRTMADMTENATQYGAAARAASKKLAILRYVVNDGQG